MIEPLVSLQWWCRMDELKQPALQALRERLVRYHPESQHRYAIDSLENCIVREQRSPMPTGGGVVGRKEEMAALMEPA